MGILRYKYSTLAAEFPEFTILHHRRASSNQHVAKRYNRGASPYEMMYTLKPSHTICSRCLARRFLSTATTSPSHSSSKPSPLPSAPPSPSGFANLRNRRLISLHGLDVSPFLQGLTTANIPPVTGGTQPGFYSTFLNAQGRVLHDVFMYPSAHCPAYRQTVTGNKEAEPTDAYLIEVDAGEVDKLVKWLKRYKLRAKVTIRRLEEEEWNIFSVWGSKELSFQPSSSSISTVDARSPTFSGQRVLLAHGSQLSDFLAAASLDPEKVPEVPLQQYTLRRYLHGIPEGPAEIIPEQALPQESNVDYMLGVDFRKGCYVGQELTIRTHHTGVVRKRILPVRLYGGNEEGEKGNVPERLEYELQDSEALGSWGEGKNQGNISRVGTKGRSAGKFLSRVGNVGLALCRLEQMVGDESGETEFRVSWDKEEGLPDEKDVRVKAFLPEWFAEREMAVGLKRV